MDFFNKLAEGFRDMRVCSSCGHYRWQHVNSEKVLSLICRASKSWTQEGGHVVCGCLNWEQKRVV